MPTMPPGVSRSAVQRIVSERSNVTTLFQRLASVDAEPFAAAPAADIPTVTSGAAATVNGVIIGPQTGQVTEVGSRGDWNAAQGRLIVQGKGGPAGLDYFLTGTTVEHNVFPAITGNLPYQLYVNGRDAGSGTVAVTASTPVYVKLAFGTSARRRVEIFFGDGINAWSQVRCDTSTLITPAPRRPVGAFVGDSFFDGSTPTPQLQACAFIMARLLGLECCSVSRGGTGYVVTGAFDIFGSSARAAIIQKAAPEIIIVSGSVNDTSNVQAAAAAAYATWATAAPKAKIVSFGVQPSNAADTISASRAARIGEIKAAAAASPNVLAFIDMVGSAAGTPATYSSGTTYADGSIVAYLGSVWKLNNGGSTLSGTAPGSSARWQLLTYSLTGTGRVGTTAGDGTRDTYLSSDAVHLTIPGSAALATRQANELREVLRRAALAA